MYSLASFFIIFFSCDQYGGEHVIHREVQGGKQYYEVQKKKQDCASQAIQRDVIPSLGEDQEVQRDEYGGEHVIHCEVQGGKQDYVVQAIQEESLPCPGGYHEIHRDDYGGDSVIHHEIQDGKHNCEEEDSPGRVRCTHSFLKTLRRLRWEKEVDWDLEDKNRLLDITEFLEEDLQDFLVPAVIIGSNEEGVRRKS